MSRVPWVVGVSGASGTPYAAAVLRGLLDAGEAVDLVVSRAARLTLLDETGLSFRDAHWRDDLTRWLGREPGDAADRDVAYRAADRDVAYRAADRDVAYRAADRDVAYRAAGDVANRAARDVAARDVADRDVTYWAAGDLGAGPASGSYPTRGMVVVPASTAAVAGIAIGLSKDLLQRAADVTLKERRPLVIVPREAPYTRATLQHMLALHDAGAVVLPASPGFYSAPRSVQQLVDFLAAKVLDAIGVKHDLITRWTGELGGARRLDE